MIFNDPIHRYVPLMWAIVHPRLIKEAKKAYDRKTIELKQQDGYWYWRRAINLPEMELGL